MSHKWSEVRHKLSPEKEAEIQQRVREDIRTIRVRKARSLALENLARVLNVNQGAVSKMEKRADMYVSTLRSYLHAMGAELQIRAIFPDGEVIIEQFQDLRQDSDEPAA